MYLHGTPIKIVFRNTCRYLKVYQKYGSREQTLRKWVTAAHFLLIMKSWTRVTYYDNPSTYENLFDMIAPKKKSDQAALCFSPPKL